MVVAWITTLGLGLMCWRRISGVGGVIGAIAGSGAQLTQEQAPGNGPIVPGFWKGQDL